MRRSRRIIVIGLTGGIGMGKSTVASQFAAFGAHAIDADRIVHGLLSTGGAAVDKVEAMFPGVMEGGAVNRKKLGALVFADKAKLDALEALLHPMVVREEAREVERLHRLGASVVVLEIPLLFEKKAEGRFDCTVTVHAPAFLQWQRVMRRQGMTHDKLGAILKRQMASHLKRRVADYTVHTGLGRAYSFRQVQNIMKELVNA